MSRMRINAIEEGVPWEDEISRVLFELQKRVQADYMELSEDFSTRGRARHDALMRLYAQLGHVIETVDEIAFLAE